MGHFRFIAPANIQVLPPKMDQRLASILSLLSQDPTRYEREIRAFDRADLKSPPPQKPVVFTGSSSIRMWTNLGVAFPNLRILNRGFGGSTMQDLIYYFDRLIAVYQPALVVVYEGDNDLAHGRSVKEIVSAFRTFAERMKVQLPFSDLAFLSVKPSPSRIDLLPHMVELNASIKEIAIKAGGYFYDIFTPMLDPNKRPYSQLYDSDMVHLNAAGYSLWQLTLTPALNQWVAEHASKES